MANDKLQAKVDVKGKIVGIAKMAGGTTKTQGKEEEEHGH